MRNRVGIRASSFNGHLHDSKGYVILLKFGKGIVNQRIADNAPRSVHRHCNLFDVKLSHLQPAWFECKADNCSAVGSIIVRLYDGFVNTYISAYIILFNADHRKRILFDAIPTSDAFR